MSSETSVLFQQASGPYKREEITVQNVEAVNKSKMRLERFEYFEAAVQI
jgi:hypothetical protein